MTGKLWGGRFAGGTHPDVEAFSSSLALDSRLWEADLTGSVAHARMLGRQGIITREESQKIVDGLESLRGPFSRGEIPQDAEDIHSAIEGMLRRAVGDVAGKLHTARSRNDQVATACRLYLRGQVDELAEEVVSLQRTLAALADKHVDTILPGFTHLQHAQPVSLAHHLLAYFWMLERDKGRLADLRKRLNKMPLGSAALAGTSLPIDRVSVARELGFDGVCENSLDAVSDRDFAAEFLAAAALIGSHLSRFAEEMVIWSTPEFGFLELDDSVTTGSSLMPQKKNPDVPELIRGRTGRLNGALTGLLTVLKALPLSYNRDLQEDKFHLFEGLDTVRGCVRLTELMLEKATWNTERMEKAATGDYSNTTDMADFLVRKGVAFRDAHEVSGKAVRLALEKGVALEAISLKELKLLHTAFDDSVYAALSPRAVMDARTSEGGTSPASVRAQLAKAQELVAPPLSTQASIALEKKFGSFNYAPLPVAFARGRGIWLWDAEGKKYADFVSGFSAIGQGHAHPRVTAAIAEQVGKLSLISRALYSDKFGIFAKYITELFGYERVLTMNSGAEAFETAVKIARKCGYKKKGIAAGRAKIIVAKECFHGRTTAALSAASLERHHQEFAPITDGFVRVPFGDSAALQEAMRDSDVCAVLLEPIQGEAGIRVPPPGYLAKAAELCKKSGALFIADEIQTGIGRTGKLLALQHEGVRADITLLGKSLSGGTLPVSTVLADTALMELLQPGDHGSTFGGSPLACHVAHTALKVVVEEGLVENSAKMGELFRATLLEAKIPGVKEIRGRGLLNAVELGYGDKPELGQKLCTDFLAAGIVAKNTRPDIFRFAPPLVISEVEMRDALAKIQTVFSSNAAQSTAQ